jgi:hypothetical protein
LREVTIVADANKRIDNFYCEGIMVDFASRKVGGGVLRKGISDEEVMYTVFPELIVTKLLC